MNSKEAGNESDRSEKTRQLLLLADLVDKYPQVVSRRVAGLVHILIGGGISFATLVFMSLQDLLGPGDPFLTALGLVVLGLVFSWVISVRLIVPLTGSYAVTTSAAQGGRAVYLLWGVLAVSIVLSALAVFQSGLAWLFPPTLQLIMGCGFMVTYVLARRAGSSSFYTVDYFYFATAILLSTIPTLLVPAAAYTVLIVADVGGIFLIGVHMLITAERLLLETKGQG